MSEKNYYQYSHKLPSGEIVVLNVDRDKVSQEQWWQEVDTFREVVWKKFMTNLEKETGVNTKPVDMGGGKPDWGNDNTFTASRLVKSVVDGKTYWKVAGLDGKFPKFPVAIWDEVIERDLCPMDRLTADSYPLDGYTATYEKNEKGNPKKVVKLEKAS